VLDPAESDSLFRVDLDQFVVERNALAKRLKAEGKKEEAASIAKLRRPAASVWALNQVARSEPGRVDAMLTAGAALRAAMEQALGGDASALRDARTLETRAVDDVVMAAAGRLRDSGHSPTDSVQQRMAATLRAAIVDEAVAGQLRAGTLDADREASGFGLDALSFPTPAVETQGATAKKRLAELASEAQRLTGRAERLEAEAAEAERRATAARASADEAATEAAAARRKAGESE
jgi:hypothetical protein